MEHLADSTWYFVREYNEDFRQVNWELFKTNDEATNYLRKIDRNKKLQPSECGKFLEATFLSFCERNQESGTKTRRFAIEKSTGEFLPVKLDTEKDGQDE